jgi:hypothetical protein
MALAPAQKPDDNAGGGNVSGTDAANAFSGTRDHGGDATNMTGQYPPGAWGNAIFGGPMPTGTGAPGTPGADPGQAGTDSTNEPGQTSDGLTGITDHDISNTGAPGAATTPNTNGGTAISYTQPGSPYSGTYQSATQQDALDGFRDSTQANDEGYASGGPQLPGLAGNEPRAAVGRFQPQAGGNVLRGGRDVRP